MYQKTLRRACSRVAKRSRRRSSFSREAKKLSASALSQGVADRAHREVDPGLLGVGAVDQAGVLRSVIRVRNDAGGVTAASGHGHSECVEDELALQIVAHRPADDPAAEDVLDDGEEEEALAGLDVLEVADPEPVPLRPSEVAVDEVRRRGPFRVTHGRTHPAATAVGATDAELAHQPSDPLLADPDAVAELQLRVDPRRAVDLFRLDVDLADPLGELAVGELTLARRTPLPRVVALTRHTDHAAQQGDGELCGLSLDEPEPRHGRSVSLAKKAAARFRISRS